MEVPRETFWNARACFALRCSFAAARRCRLARCLDRVVRRGDEVINLTKREYELLLILMENINVVMSRKDLLSKVWGYDSKVETNVVDVYIRYLRNKIDRPGEKSYIQTVRGTGYVIRS